MFLVCLARMAIISSFCFNSFQLPTFILIIVQNIYPGSPSNSVLRSSLLTSHICHASVWHQLPLELPGDAGNAFMVHPRPTHVFIIKPACEVFENVVLACGDSNLEDLLHLCLHAEFRISGTCFIGARWVQESLQLGPHFSLVLRLPEYCFGVR